MIAASENVNFIALTLQDQIRVSLPDEEFVFALQNLKMLSPRAPMVVFSLAANSMDGYDDRLVEKLSPAKRRFFDYLAERSLSIGLRGEYTLSVLEKMGISNGRVVGCPSYFETGPDRHVEHAATRRGFRDAGLTGAFGAAELGAHVRYMQGDFEWPAIQLLHTQPGEWTAAQEAMLAKAPGLTSELLEDLADRRAWFFIDPDAWKAHIAKHCAAVCGTRLHGAIAALNAGVPAVVTNADARATETCEYLGIPHRPDLGQQAINRSVLEDITDPAEVNARYSRLFGNFQSWLEGLGLKMALKPNSVPETPLARPTQREISRRVIRVFSQRSRHIPETTQTEEPYGANLLVDPTFAFGLKFWTPISSSDEAPDWTIESDEGGRQAVFEQDLHAEAYRIWTSQWIPIDATTPLSLSVELSRRNVASGNVFCDLEWAAPGLELGSTPPISATGAVYNRLTANLYPVDGATLARLRFYTLRVKFGPSGGRLAVRRPKLESGRTPTRFSDDNTLQVLGHLITA